MAKARRPGKADDFFAKSRFVQLRLAGIANQVGHDTATWLAKVAKSTTSFNDRTSSLRESIRAGVHEKAKFGKLIVEIALSAGYDDVFYTDETGRTVKTSEYARSIELGGPNPLTGKNNSPRPFIIPTMNLADTLGIVPNLLKKEMRARLP